MNEQQTVLPSYKQVKDELVPIPNFDKYYACHQKLGKIFNKQSGKWLLVDAKGVGDKRYLLTKLKSNDGEWIPVYEYEAIFASYWGQWKTWRNFGRKMEIEHKDRNPKNNNI